MTNAINGFLAGRQMRMQEEAFRQQRDERQRAQGQQNSFMKAQSALAGGDRDAARNFAAGSGVQGYSAIQQQIAGMDERAREQGRERLQSLGGVAMGLMQVPAEQRSAWVTQNGSLLTGYGLNPQEIAGMDLSDQNLQAFVTTVRNADREWFGESTAPVTLGENESRIDPTTGAQMIGNAGIAARGLERQANAISQQNADTARGRLQLDQQQEQGPDWDAMNSLRGEGEDLIRDYRKIEEAFSRVAASAEDPSAAGDLALIFNYMKMLDPGSTVREGEFATAQNAGGVNSRVVSFYNSMLNGERLTVQQRADFVDRARRLFAEQQRVANERLDPLREQSRERGFDPRYSVPQLVSEPEFNASAPPPPGIDQVSDEELQRIIDGG